MTLSRVFLTSRPEENNHRASNLQHRHMKVPMTSFSVFLWISRKALNENCCCTSRASRLGLGPVHARLSNVSCTERGAAPASGRESRFRDHCLCVGLGIHVDRIRARSILVPGEPMRARHGGSRLSRLHDLLHQPDLSKARMDWAYRSQPWRFGARVGFRRRALLHPNAPTSPAALAVCEALPPIDGRELPRRAAGFGRGGAQRRQANKARDRRTLGQPTASRVGRRAHCEVLRLLSARTLATQRSRDRFVVERIMTLETCPNAGEIARSL
jgi:hypothetical protein